MTTLSAQHDQRADPTPSADRPEVCALLIEPRPSNASELRSLLGATAAARFTVLRTATVAAGLDALAFGGVDLVLLGAGVPLQASTVVPLLRGAGDAIPVLALTDSVDPHDALDILATGVHDCIPVRGVTADGLGWPATRAVQRARASSGRVRAAAVPADRVAPPLASISRQAMQTATPAVAALVGLLELLTTAWNALDEEQKLGLLATIRSCASTVAQLTAQADRFAEGPPEPQLVALAAAVVDAARRLDDLAVDVEVDAHTAVWLDPGQLRAILTGLLTHAAQRTGSPLTVTASNGGATVRVSVTGPDAEPRVAGRGFSLLHATSAAFEDDEGAGLDAARRVAEQSGGIAGVDEHCGSVWARLPNGPQHANLI